MKVKINKRNVNKYGVRKYAEIKSEASGFISYTVGKVRKRNNNYKYICSCPSFFYRQKACKHIKKFKEAEKLV